MICVAIKYFFICLCCMVIFSKLLNIITTKSYHLLNALFSTFFAASAVVFRTYFLDLSILLLYALILIYTYFIYKNGFNMTLTSTIIAYSISFFMFLISLFLTASIGHMFAPKQESLSFDIVTNLTVGILEIVFSVLLFKIKRLKKGMPFLLNKGSSDVGIFISISLIITFVFNSHNINMNTQKVLVFISLLCGLITIIWWRKRLYSDYLKKLKENDINELQQTSEAQKQTIANLTSTNEEMLKIIKKDNKLIPVMQAAVNDLITRDKGSEAEKLLAQLNSLYNERLEILKTHKTSRKKGATNDLHCD